MFVISVGATSLTALSDSLTANFTNNSSETTVLSKTASNCLAKNLPLSSTGISSISSISYNNSNYFARLDEGTYYLKLSLKDLKNYKTKI